MTRTKAGTIEEEGRQKTTPPPEAVTKNVRQAADHDDLELDRFLYRVGSNRGLTIEEFLRDDFGPGRTSRNPPSYTPSHEVPMQQAVLADRASASADGYTLKSSPPVSTLQPSVKGSWSASSFV